MMSLPIKTVSCLLMGLLVVLLAACQSWQANAPDQKPVPPHRGAAAGAGSSGAAGSGTGAGSGHMMANESWYGMCELNRRIMAGRTPEERQAAAEQAMPNMSQASREQRLRMMRQRCQ